MDSCQRLDLIDYIFLCIHLFSAFHLNILSLLSCIMCVKCRECYVKHAHPLRCSSKYSISKMKRMSFRHEFGSRFFVFIHLHAMCSPLHESCDVCLKLNMFLFFVMACARNILRSYHD